MLQAKKKMRSHSIKPQLKKLQANKLCKSQKRRRQSLRNSNKLVEINKKSIKSNE